MWIYKIWMIFLIDWKIITKTLKINSPSCCCLLFCFLSDKEKNISQLPKRVLLCCSPFVVPGFSWGSFMPTFFFFFFCLGPSLSSRVSRPDVAPANQEVSSPSSLPVCQFSPLLSGQQTVEERASLSKLMARALLPGLKMNRNVVYLKHTRPPPGRKITQHTNSRPRLWVIFYPGGETCCSQTISFMTMPLLFDLPPFHCLFCVCLLYFGEREDKNGASSAKTVDSSLRMGLAGM